jgi:hypothetical protein
MTHQEFCTKIFEAYEANHESKNGEYYFVGIRFEQSAREVGEICNNSKHNIDRDDEREFPAYGSDDYNEMPALNGSSTWIIPPHVNSADDLAKLDAIRCQSRNDALDVRSIFGDTNSGHCYVVAGMYEDTPSDADQGEVVIEDAKVVAVIY